MFNVSHLNDFDGFVLTTESILTDKAVSDKMINMFFAQGSDIPFYSGISSMNKFLYCRFSKPDFDSYFSCTRYRSCIFNLIYLGDFMEYIYRFNEIFSGSWFRKVEHDMKTLF